MSKQHFRMAENKKSFVMYADWQHTVKELTDEEAGVTSISIEV